jgi:glycosyltransferase involved in cell wall biosynthesis
MNIAFFCDAYKPTRNGVAVSVETTAEELRSRGHRVVIFAPRYKGYEDESPDVIRFHAGHWFRAKDFPVAKPTLAHLNWQAWVRFQREKFDIVHSHSPFTLGCVGSRWAARHSIPIVFTFHTLYHHYLHYVPVPKPVIKPYLHWRLKNYCYSVDHIIVPSRPVNKIVQKIRPGVPITVLPTGIDIERFQNGNRERVRKKYGIKPDETLCLYVGRIVLEKNLVFLIKALLPLLQSTLTLTKLMLVGGGPAMDDLKALASQLGIEDRVIFTDFIDQSEIADYFAAGDIFTFASKTETQGVSIGEALASGLPCVVVGVMGAAEAVTDGEDGYVVPPREDDFRRAVQQLAENGTLRHQMSEYAQKHASRLSRESVAERLLDLYGHVRTRRKLDSGRIALEDDEAPWIA